MGAGFAHPLSEGSLSTATPQQLLGPGLAAATSTLFLVSSYLRAEGRNQRENYTEEPYSFPRASSNIRWRTESLPVSPGKEKIIKGIEQYGLKPEQHIVQKCGCRCTGKFQINTNI